MGSVEGWVYRWDGDRQWGRCSFGINVGHSILTMGTMLPRPDYGFAGPYRPHYTYTMSHGEHGSASLYKPNLTLVTDSFLQFIMP